MVIKNSLRGKKVLITCGPTWVALDPVRVISNISTGELAHTIADKVQKGGARVTILEGAVTHTLKVKCAKTIKFCFFHELSKLLDNELKKKYDIIIHAAAVSDYQPGRRTKTKLPSNRSRLRINLIPTQKLINKIRTRSPKSYLVGFKLETQLGRNQLIIKASQLIKASGCDLVVANTFVNKRYLGYILDKKKCILSRGTTRQKIAQNLVQILKEKL